MRFRQQRQQEQPVDVPKKSRLRFIDRELTSRDFLLSTASQFLSPAPFSTNNLLVAGGARGNNEQVNLTVGKSGENGDGDDDDDDSHLGREKEHQWAQDRTRNLKKGMGNPIKACLCLCFTHNDYFPAIEATKTTTTTEMPPPAGD